MQKEEKKIEKKKKKKFTIFKEAYIFWSWRRNYSRIKWKWRWFRKLKIIKEREQLLIKEFEEMTKKEEYFKKIVWVFLDEINTCNSRD